MIGLNHEIILTSKFSLMYGIAGHKIMMFIIIQLIFLQQYFPIPVLCNM